MKDVNVLAMALIGKSEAVVKSAKELKHGFSFSKLMNIAKEIANVVENYKNEVGELSSDTKLALGIEILVNTVDVPYVPQWVERKIYQIVLNKAVKYMQGSALWKKANEVGVEYLTDEDEQEDICDKTLKPVKQALKKASKETVKKVKLVRPKLNKRLGR